MPAGIGRFARSCSAICIVAACGSHAASSDAPLRAIDAAGDAGTDGPAGGSACPAGSTLVVDRSTCGSAVAPPGTLLATTAQPGDVVSMDGLDEGSLPCMPAVVCAPAGAATMLFSDDPESPATDGVLYADTFGPGHARIYVYHVNAGTDPRKFPIVVLDQGSADAHVTITREGLGGPSTDYVDVGKSVAAAWLASSLSTEVTVPAGTRVLLDAALDGEHAATNQLVHAIVDVEADAPVKISVVSVLATEDAASLTASLPLLANDGLHDRGTFAGADMLIDGSAGGEGPSARHVRLGDNSTEPDLTGTDATTGAPATLHGNYGVAYAFAVTAGSATAFAASARGGAWAGALDATTVVPLPAASGGLATTTDAVWLGSAATFTIVSGGGSSLPVDVLALSQ
ncbi:MAG TPA: hypothetical protein VGL61_37110 [Kofleriaceae bacterium]